MVAPAPQPGEAQPVPGDDGDPGRPRRRAVGVPGDPGVRPGPGTRPGSVPGSGSVRPAPVSSPGSFPAAGRRLQRYVHAQARDPQPQRSRRVQRRHSAPRGPGSLAGRVLAGLLQLADQTPVPGQAQRVRGQRVGGGGRRRGTLRTAQHPYTGAEQSDRQPTDDPLGAGHGIPSWSSGPLGRVL
ncbi:hypothetical protein GCM10020254_42500 [Streptomyces goshikiensis]